MGSATADGTAAISLITAILQEIDARDPGFAPAALRRVEVEIEKNDNNPAYRDALVDALDLIRPDLPA